MKRSKRAASGASPPEIAATGLSESCGPAVVGTYWTSTAYVGFASRKALICFVWTSALTPTPKLCQYLTTFWPAFGAGRPTMPGFSVGVGCNVTGADVAAAACVGAAAAAGAEVAAGAAVGWLHAARAAPAAMAVKAARAPRRVIRESRMRCCTGEPPRGFVIDRALQLRVDSDWLLANDASTVETAAPVCLADASTAVGSRQQFAHNVSGRSDCTGVDSPTGRQVAGY